MGLILPILLLGLLASLSPSTIVVFILLLETTRARVNAVAFLIGWAASLTFVFLASFELAANDATQDTTTHTAVLVAEVLLGVALVAVAVHQWRRRRNGVLPSPKPAPAPQVATRLKDLKPWGAVVVGVLKQPWAITAAAALVVVHHQPGPVATAVAFLTFTVVSTATVGWLYLYYAFHPGEAEAGLTALRDRVSTTGPRYVPRVALVAGLLLVVDGVVGLS